MKERTFRDGFYANSAAKEPLKVVAAGDAVGGDVDFRRFLRIEVVGGEINGLIYNFIKKEEDEEEKKARIELWSFADAHANQVEKRELEVNFSALYERESAQRRK